MRERTRSRLVLSAGIFLLLISLLTCDVAATTEIRYFRADTNTINGIQSFLMGDQTSTSTWTNDKYGPSGSTGWGGIRVWKRSSGGIETEITSGTPVAQVSTTTSGYFSATWACPQTSLEAGDTVLIKYYYKFGAGSWTYSSTPPFGSGYGPGIWQISGLGSGQLDAATWTVYYYLAYGTFAGGSQCLFYWGSSSYNSRIVNFAYTPQSVVTVTSTTTLLGYTSSTAKITSTTIVTNLLSTTSTRLTTTSAITTAPPIISTVQSPTTTYSTTYTTTPSTTEITTRTTTTTTYTGLSSTTTILSTTGTAVTTTATSASTLSSTTTTTTATSYSTSYTTTGTATSYSTTSSTVLTGTNYAYSTTTIGTIAATTKTTIVGTTTTTQTGATNTVLIIYTEQRNVVTTYTESVRVSQSVLGRLDFDVLGIQIFKLMQTSFTSFFELVQNLLTDVVTFFEQTLFSTLEQVQVYEPMGVQVTINSNPQGTGFVKVDGEPYATPHTFNWKWGEIHQIEALSPVSAGPGIRYAFVSWSDGGGQIHTITVQSPMTITANYQFQYQLTIQVANPAKGTTDPAPGEHWYSSGTNQPVTAQPTPGNQLNHWELDGNNVGSANPYTVLMDTPHTLKAIFEASQVAVTIASYPAGPGYLKVDGAPVETPYSTSWAQRSVHSIEAITPVGNWRFKEWTGGGYSGSTQNPLSVQVEGDSWSIQAIYSVQYQLTVSTNPSGISPQPTVNPPGPWYDDGTIVTLTAQTVVGMDFRYWKVDDVSQGDGIMQITVQMTADHVAVAHYMYKSGPVSKPSVTFSFTAPVVTPLLTILTLVAALILRRRKLGNTRCPHS